MRQAIGEPAVVPFGEGALRLELPPGLSRRDLMERLRGLPAVSDVVVAERHACVRFDPGGPVPDLLAALQPEERPPSQEVETVVVPVRYGGPDLAAVAAWAGLSEEEVVARHVAPLYTVEVVGFLPGFAYLATVDPSIAAPRLPAPRVRVPAGSVGIAGGRTGIYPFASPGGWNLIGTAVGFSPFDPVAGARLRLGDRVRFEHA